MCYIGAHINTDSVAPEEERSKLGNEGFFYDKACYVLPTELATLHKR